MHQLLDAIELGFASCSSQSTRVLLRAVFFPAFLISRYKSAINKANQFQSASEGFFFTGIDPVYRSLSAGILLIDHFNNKSLLHCFASFLPCEKYTKQMWWYTTLTILFVLIINHCGNIWVTLALFLNVIHTKNLAGDDPTRFLCAATHIFINVYQSVSMILIPSAR